MSVDIIVRLPDDVYRALLQSADRHGTQVHCLIEHAITTSVRRPPKKTWRKFTEAEVARICELNAQGWPDNRIAKEIGRNQSAVSARLRALGLPSPTPRHPGAGRRKAA